MRPARRGPLRRLAAGHEEGHGWWLAETGESLSAARLIDGLRPRPRCDHVVGAGPPARSKAHDSRQSSAVGCRRPAAGSCGMESDGDAGRSPKRVRPTKDALTGPCSSEPRGAVPVQETKWLRSGSGLRRRRGPGSSPRPPARSRTCPSARPHRFMPPPGAKEGPAAEPRRLPPAQQRRNLETTTAPQAGRSRGPRHSPHQTTAARSRPATASRAPAPASRPYVSALETARTRQSGPRGQRGVRRSALGRPSRPCRHPGRPRGLKNLIFAVNGRRAPTRAEPANPARPPGPPPARPNTDNTLREINKTARRSTQLFTCGFGSDRPTGALLYASSPPRAPA